MELIMIDETQKKALIRWYSQAWVLEAVRKSKEEENWDDVEAHVQRHILMPLSKHSELPDYMKNEDNSPLFPTNCNPMNDEEIWQDAIEIGWKVMEEKVGLPMDFVQAQIKSEIDADWEVFMKSVDERKKKKD